MKEIDIVDYDTLSTVETSLIKMRSEPPDNGYEIWLQYHSDLCQTASRYGAVSDDYQTPQDFYYSGDWFHHCADGFAMQTIKGLSRRAFQDLQEVVARHDPNASLSLCGDTGSPIYGLEILITSNAILVAWYKETALSCEQRLARLGIRLE